MAGAFLWPASEPWPHCEEHGCPFVTVLQLRREDVPELGFRDDADLFQLLWCPNDHETIDPSYAPASRVFWRKRATIADALAAMPDLTTFCENYVPTPGVLHPERVIEYPDAAAIEEDYPRLWKAIERSNPLRQMIQNHPEFDGDDGTGLYQYWLSVAAGTKVAGYPQWIQDADPPTCECSRQMEYLLTVASAEFDGGTWGRWLAQEERHVWGADFHQRNAVQCAANLTLGDLDNLNYFICRQCEDWPVASVFQCS